MRLLVFIFMLLCNPLYATELIVTSVPATIQSDNAALSAEQAWEALLNKADPVFLDHFIATYPESDEAKAAFTLRFNGVQTSRTIPHYHAFIEKYVDTLAAEQALYELFALYRQQNTLAGYFDFIKRYPNTSQAVIAKLHVEALAFELTTKLDTVEEYDSFIAMFPTAVQVLAAEKLAQKKFLELETIRLKNESDRLKHRLAEENQRMSELEARLETEPTLAEDFSFLEKQIEIQNSITGLESDIRHLKETQANGLATLMETEISLAEKAKSLQAQNHHWRIVERYYYLLRSDIYNKTVAQKRVRLEKRHQAILKNLEDIRQAIKDSNKSLIVALQSEFAKTRQVLRDGFKRLHLDNKLINKSLQQLVASVEVLHQDIVEVNRNLVEIHQSLLDVRKTIAQSNQLLVGLHKDLGQIHGNLIRLNKDMNQGMEKQNALLRVAAKTVKQGFNQLHADMEASQLQTAQLHQEKLALASRQLYANQRIAKALEKTQQESQITIKAIAHQTEVTVYNTEKLLAVDRQTQGLISKQTKQFAEIAKQQSIDSGGGFGGFLKGLVSTAVNSFVPGLGAIVGPLVDIVSDVVQGKDFGEAIIGGAKGIVGEHCPPCAPAMDVAEGLVQGKNPGDVLLNVAKGQLGNYCPECTPFVDVAGDLLQNKDLGESLKTLATSQLGTHCPECMPLWNTVEGITQGKPPEQLITQLVGNQVGQYCPDCMPVVQAVQEIAAGKPIEIVLQENLSKQLKIHCPECTPYVSIAQKAIAGENIVDVAAQALSQSCPECMPTIDAVRSLAKGEPPVNVLKQVLAEPLQATCPTCGTMLNVASDLAAGNDITATLTKAAQTEVATVCPECMSSWETAEKLLQGENPKTVITTLITEKITEQCEGCAPVLDTMQQIAQGKNPLDIVVETTQQQLAKDCPECSEVLQTIIPIAQREALDTTNNIIAQLQRQLINPKVSKQISETLNAVLSERGLMLMPVQVQNISDGLPRITGLNLRFLPVDKTLQTQLNQQGLQIGSGKSLPTIQPVTMPPMSTQPSKELVETLKKFL